MDVTQALDREQIVERAEEVRFWLLSYPLSNRATGAIQRELGAIIADEGWPPPNGRRPLAGLTVADFVAELHRPDGGAVGRVKSVGDLALRELRAAIRPSAGRRALPELEAPEQEAPELEAPELEAPELEAPELELPALARAVGEAAPLDAAPRRRGRPRKEPQPADGAAPRRRGRPRRAEAPAPALATVGVTAADAAWPPAGATAPGASAGDPALAELMRRWPGLHPHARRAVVLYASTLLAEAAYDG